jgi:hypothetical protein
VIVLTRARCLLKRDSEEARERVEDPVAVRVRPAQPLLQETQPTNTIRSVDTKQRRKGKLGNWDGGGNTHWEQEEWTATKKARASPHPHTSSAAGRRRGGLEASPPRSLARSRVQLPRPTLWHPPNSCLSAFATRSICARS